MKSFLPLAGCLFLLIASPGAFAETTPSPAVAPASPAPAKDKKPDAAITLAPAPVSPAKVTFDDYMKDLADELKLTDDEKKFIRKCYLNDGMLLHGALNTPSFSSRQRAIQVAEMRDARNARIEGMLQSLDRQLLFREIEAKYRVTITKMAAEGELMNLSTQDSQPPPAPASAPVQPSPENSAQPK